MFDQLKRSSVVLNDRPQPRLTLEHRFQDPYGSDHILKYINSDPLRQTNDRPYHVREERVPGSMKVGGFYGPDNPDN